MTDDLEPRVTRLEQRVTDLARVEQRVTDLDDRVTALVPLTADFRVLNERVVRVQEDVAAFAAAAAADRRAASEREDNRRKERTATRQWAIGILVAILLGVLTAAVVVIVQGGH